MFRHASAFACLIGLPGTALCIGSVFTYQGQLRENGAPANGSYDLQFTLQTSAGAPVGMPVETMMPSRTVNVSGATFTLVQFDKSRPLKSGTNPSSSAAAHVSVVKTAAAISD